VTDLDFKFLNNLKWKLNRGRW